MCGRVADVSYYLPAAVMILCVVQMRPFLVFFTEDTHRFLGIIDFSLSGIL